MATAQVVVQGLNDVIEGVKEWRIAWTSTDLGVVAVSLTPEQKELLRGWYLFEARTNPGATTPTASWDYTLKDDEGIDLMGGLGTDMSNSASVLQVPKLDGTNYGDVLIQGGLAFAVANAGDAKNGVSIFFFRKDAGR